MDALLEGGHALPDLQVVRCLLTILDGLYYQPCTSLTLSSLNSAFKLAFSCWHVSTYELLFRVSATQMCRLLLGYVTCLTRFNKSFCSGDTSSVIGVNANSRLAGENSSAIA